MRKSIFYTAIFFFIYIGCSTGEPQKTISFIPLNERKFNFSVDSSFAEPQGKVWEERKRFHDSCMGETFAANASFIKTKDTFFVGAVVNMQTMRVVKKIDLRNIVPGTFGAAFIFMTKPCYEKWEMRISLDSFINKKVELNIPGANEKVNNELKQALKNSVLTEMETGSWVNIELTDAFGKILDTTTNPQLIEYKKYLLDTANMVLIKSSSITDASFYIHTPKPMSAELLQALSQKPVLPIENSNMRMQLFFISSTRFQVKFNGIFQIMGQFMQCELE
jgi:hypothetical protein